ncbi:PhaM family polyhydroxyalkanoate granule multifunctional regulatory protein [Denitromonas ohlonensis]|uniref:PhaM family polyhydroxyalkanoate granule multifunctional regulatory protein n=1 Tax=Denitromonas ohlonensis TaxID=3078508 RepID=UPI003703B1B5
MSHESSSDPLDFVRNMWSGMGFSLPGMVTPTLDVDELEKRITDMKAVEGWLKMNLNMLQMSIQGLEMQHATLTTIKAMGEATRQKGPDAADTNDSPNNANPFNNAALWSWLQAMSGAAPEAAAQATPQSEPPESSAEGSNPFAGVAAAATNAAASAAMWPWQLMPEKASEKKAAPAKKPAAKKPASSARAKPAAARTPAAKKPAAAPRKKT